MKFEVKWRGSNHVDTEIAGVKSCGHGSRWQRGSKHVDTGVAGGEMMVKARGHGSCWGSAGSKQIKALWTRESLGVKSWSKHVERELVGVSGGQSM